jgi:hypothetical protein
MRPGDAFHLPRDWRVLNPSGHFTDNAYVLVLSNEEFIDGAIVMGASLRNHSNGIAQGKIQLVIIVTAGRLRPESIMRLVEVGFDVVAEVPSLAVRVPHAFFKDTFDKAYMFALTTYRKIVFMDADMLAVRSPDALFAKDYGPDEHWVGAIGFRDGKQGDYFQTGMMVVRPNAGVFATIMDEFDRNAPPKGKKYNSGMNGRDGVLLRTVFGARFKSIDNKYSRNLNPRYPIPNHVVCIHLRGKHKPWFDWKGPVADAELGKKEFGFTYLAWWEQYERIHYASAAYAASARGEAVPGYGGRWARDDVTPLTHVWLLRFTTKEYVQLLGDVDRKLRDNHPEGLQLYSGAAGESCDDVCNGHSLRCMAKAFNFTQLQSCDELKQRFACDVCELAVYWRPHPGHDFPGLDTRKGTVCRWNLMRDERSRSSCAGRNETTRRLCPCAPGGRDNED